MRINGYKVESIGNGGNATVFKAEKKNGDIFALKRLDNAKTEQKERFIREATFGDSYPDLVSKNIILPVFEFINNEDSQHYTMPLCTPIKDYRFNSLQEKCNAIDCLLYKLAVLHKKGLAHRDIKPENILVYDGGFYFSDFGLLYIEKAERITKPQSNERIGAKRTIAPEMERNQSYDADKFKADIYSMAKTIWMILTGDYECFEGQYSSDSIISLTKYDIGTFEDSPLNFETPYYKPLEEILNKCTDHNPDNRLDAETLLDEFRSWLEVNENFDFKNKKQWRETLHRIFPEVIPVKAEWNNTDDIIKIINILCQYKGLVYTFLPCGGQHIRGAKRANENKFIEFDFGIPTLYPVKSLTFYSLGGEDGWYYFRLDPIDGITPIFVQVNNKDKTDADERLTELSPGNYAPYEVYEYEEDYKGFSPTKDMRVIDRYYSGSMLFFNTRSPYNLETSTHGRHSEFTKEEFEFYLQGCYEHKYKLRYSEYEIQKAKDDYHINKPF